MRKVKNKATVKNLSLKNYKSSKRRNRTAIAAIALTTVLFTIIFTLGVGLAESMQYNNMRMSGGSAHASLKYLSSRQYEDMKDHSLIKKIGKNVVAGTMDQDELIKRPVELNCSDKKAMEMGFVKLKEGHLPKEEGDIILDTTALDLLGVPHRVGEKFTQTVDFSDRREEVEFTLCGYYEGDAAFLSSMGYVSDSFVEKYLKGRGQDYWKTVDSLGSIRADIMFANSSKIEENVKRVINDAGYQPQEESEVGEDIIAYGVNWAYLSASFSQDAGESMVLLIPAALLIIFSGYLIIYNVFQISVIRDIRFYGLLKTIGTTGRQVRAILIRQAMRMCCWGIPIGLILGFMTGRILLPVVMSNLSGGEAKLSIHPIIFIGSAVFSLVTVFISCRKPARIASRVSPVEAVKYSGVSERYQKRKKVKKSLGGAKSWRMAFSNLGRNRKRTVIAVISMSLSLVLMNSVFTLVGSFDMDKFVQQFISVGFQTSHASYFNYTYNRSKTPVSQEMIKAIESQPGFGEGGCIYTPLQSDSTSGSLRASYEGTIKSMFGEGDISISENEGLDTGVYAMDDFCLENLRIIRGSLDMEKLKAKKGVLLGVLLDDYGHLDEETLYFDIGDEITLRPVTSFEVENEVLNERGEPIEYDMIFEYGEPQTFEVVGIYALDFTNSSRSYGDYVTVAMTPEQLTDFGVALNPMTYLCDSLEDEVSKEQMEQFFKTYTEQMEPTMKYVSKYSYQGQFKQIQMSVVLVGGTLCAIIGLIGVLNFMNSISTSIIARKREFAMLSSIGMTGKQLKVMLCLEGIYYGLFTLGISLAVSILFSYGALSKIGNVLWFCSFHANFLPVTAAGLLLVGLGVLIPLLCYRREQGSIVEQLRENE